MSLQTFLLLFLVLGLPALGAAAEGPVPVQVLGVSDREAGGNRNPALRHRDCAETFPGSHWCSTREYLEGGIAIEAESPLPTAWIRPTLVGGSLNSNGTVVYLDAAGLRATQKTLHCSQWSGNREDEQGFALQTTRNGKKQKVIQVTCDRKRPALCCGYPSVSN